MDRAARIAAACAGYDVPLAAAALQFVVARPAVPCFCAGLRKVQQLDQSLAWMQAPIPAAFWQALKTSGLLRKDAPVLP